MFESARVKLTFFYLAILLGFSLLLTVGFRVFTHWEITKANDVQRGAVHDIGQLFYGQNDDTAPPPGMTPDRTFARIQTAQDRETQGRLNREMVLLNVGVLVFGGALSYWYAGRTLRPIQQAHEKQRRFTADASHELRTPLASMRLENEVFLRQKTFTEHDAREQLASNLEEVDRLERLTTSLLELNRYESTTLTRKKLAVRTIVDEAIKRATPMAETHGMSFTVQVTKANVEGDFESLVQLLCIFFENARKYGPEKGVVEVTGKKAGGYVLTVRDHGPGIAAEDLPHIFERMYRGDKARTTQATGGHGIGLSLAQQIAEANGVTVSAHNHPDGGAVFSITFPAG